MRGNQCVYKDFLTTPGRVLPLANKRTIDYRLVGRVCGPVGLAVLKWAATHPPACGGLVVRSRKPQRQRWLTKCWAGACACVLFPRVYLIVRVISARVHGGVRASAGRSSPRKNLGQILAQNGISSSISEKLGALRGVAFFGAKRCSFLRKVSMPLSVTEYT